jgi:hypothetical protein
MIERELLTRALYWMEGNGKWQDATVICADIKQALIQPDNDTSQKRVDETAKHRHEPVAWQWLNTAHFRKKLPKDAEKGAWNPLYTTPPKRKPLSDEEMFKLWLKVPAETEDRFAFARAIEAAHGIGEKK